MKTEFASQYPFITISFTFHDVDYSAMTTAELYPEEDALDFTGSYHCILISSQRGTKTFNLVPDPHLRWVSEPAGLDRVTLEIRSLFKDTLLFYINSLI